MSTEHSVAEYFACNAAFGDRYDGHADSRPLILTLDGEALLSDNYEFTTFEPDAKSDWENEVSCWSDISELDDVLLSVEIVPLGRYLEYLAHGRDAFMQGGPPLARLMLEVMSDVIDRLVEGGTTARKADAVVSTLKRVRSAVCRRR